MSRHAADPMIGDAGPAPGDQTIGLPPDQWDLRIRLWHEERHYELASAAASVADVVDLQCEVWRDHWLRKGRPDAPLDSLQFQLLPRFVSADDTRCRGILLRARARDGGSAEREFTAESVGGGIAARLRQELTERKVLGGEEELMFELHARRRDAAARPAGGAAPEDGLWVEGGEPPLDYLKISLNRLLERAKDSGPQERVFPVFYTREALEDAERCARAGAALDPPRETGGVLLGPLCACPDTGEFFPVVCQVLPVRDAEEQEFALSYSDRSWARIQTIVRAMQAQPATRAFRLLGQCHGHNFLPGGGAAPCEACSTLQVCRRTSVFASVDDRLWSQAVFSRQPWQLCHIFGTNARREQIASLFTLHDNQLRARGFHVIPSL